MEKRDPHNILIARGPRRRMSAEQVRDNALAVSGLLVKTIGGPSVYPYQPDGMWAAGTTQYRYPKPEEISADEQHRRSLYTFLKRNTPPPSMSVFDFSERHASISRRLTSNTPLQALVLMDDPQYLEAYSVLATRVFKEKRPGRLKSSWCSALQRAEGRRMRRWLRCALITNCSWRSSRLTRKRPKTWFMRVSSQWTRPLTWPDGCADQCNCSRDEFSRRLFNPLGAWRR